MRIPSTRLAVGLQGCANWPAFKVHLTPAASAVTSHSTNTHAKVTAAPGQQEEPQKAAYNSMTCTHTGVRVAAEAGRQAGLPWNTGMELNPKGGRLHHREPRNPGFHSGTTAAR
jgi:hypothetical protein